MVVGPVVHPTNPVGSLTVTQLQGIYTAHIPSWSELKGSRTSIRLYGLSSDSPIEQLLREKLGVNRLSVRVIRRSATAQVVAAVARDPTAIGFVDLSELSPKDSSVKLLKVVLPEKPFGVSARDDDYPLARAYTLYAAPGMDETTREFARFLMSGRGAGVIVRHGLLPSTPLPEGPLRGTEAARR